MTTFVGSVAMIVGLIKVNTFPESDLRGKASLSARAKPETKRRRQGAVHVVAEYTTSMRDKTTK
jgi:hypothetical protein